MLLLGAGSGVVLLGMFAIVIRGLPALAPLHFDAGGAVDVTGPPGRLYLLPAIAWLTWLVNLLVGLALLRRAERRMAALGLWGGTLFVHALVWGAALLLFSVM